MEYAEALTLLEELRQREPDMGTETTQSLLDVHGNPHADLTAVQIAGSNGKGSTASVLDSILRKAGLTVGLYTSPGLNDLRGRIRVQGRKIPKHEVVQFVADTRPHVVSAERNESPTFFEVLTAMALWYFERERVDIAVLEVGIGGRYDATSVVDPAAAAVTSVSLEHTEMLGSTVQEIARDKAQVTPEDAPLVTGASGVALETIRDLTEVVTVGGESDVDGRAERTDRSDREASADVQVTETEMLSRREAGLTIVWDDWTVRTRTPLLGRHQAVNAGIAATLARQVAGPSERDVAAGIRNVDWPGRFEIVSERPLVVLDGAHNPAACEALSALLDRFEYDSLVLVFGAMRDKDHPAMIRALPPAQRAIFAQPDMSRATDTDVLASVFDRQTSAPVTEAESVPGAVAGAVETADPNDCVLVTGSLYVVADARDRWT